MFYEVSHQYDRIRVMACSMTPNLGVVVSAMMNFVIGIVLCIFIGVVRMPSYV